MSLLGDIKEKIFDSGDNNNNFSVEFFNLSKKIDQEKMLCLLKDEKIISIIDDFLEQKNELDLITEPKKIFLKNIIANKKENYISKGLWIYFSWRGTLVHCLDKSNFYKLRVSRNMGIISYGEQEKIKNIKIAIAGLNVGNPGAVCLALTGAESLIKLADLDPLSLSNLNRFRAGICDLGINKVILTARQIKEINPFSNIEIYSNGISNDNIDDFLQSPRVDILVEEMDNLELKILIRKKAMQAKIPVLMVTGNAENVIVDVERYDIDKNSKLLNGLISKKVLYEVQKGDIEGKRKIFLARDFMGKKYLDKRLWESFSLVGDSIIGIPQLAESSFIRGAAISYFARKILLDKSIKSGRYYLKLSQK